MCDLHDTAEALRKTEMIQTMRKLDGEISPCPQCGRQPFHVHVRGRELHFFECPPCELKSVRKPTMQEALQTWEDLPRSRAA